MKSIYLNSNLLSKSLLEETLAFYTQYLITERSSFCCYLSHFINLYNEKELWDQNFIINSLYHLNPDLETDFPKATELENIAHARKLKHKKKRSVKEIRFVDAQRERLDIQKQLLVNEFKKKFHNAGISKWVDLFSPLTVVAKEYFTPDSEESINCNFYSSQIKNLILISDFFYFFNITLPYKFKMEMVNSVDPSNNNNAEKSFGYSFPLLSMPVCYNITKEHMKIIRDNFQRKISTLSGILDVFYHEIKYKDFGIYTIEKTKTLYKTIKPEIDIFQKEIDNELYFQQYINSIASVSYVHLYAAVVSIENLTCFYEANGILLPYLADALRKELAMHTDLNKCRMILYWDNK